MVDTYFYVLYVKIHTKNVMASIPKGVTFPFFNTIYRLLETLFKSVSCEIFKQCLDLYDIFILHSDPNSFPCASNPCRNNGICIPLVGGYICQCPDGFLGTNCDTRMLLLLWILFNSHFFVVFVVVVIVDDVIIIRRGRRSSSSL
jgi:hypothetical protein